MSGLGSIPLASKQHLSAPNRGSMPDSTPPTAEEDGSNRIRMSAADLASYPSLKPAPRTWKRSHGLAKEYFDKTPTKSFNAPLYTNMRRPPRMSAAELASYPSLKTPLNLKTDDETKSVAHPTTVPPSGGTIMRHDFHGWGDPIESKIHPGHYYWANGDVALWAADPDLPTEGGGKPRKSPRKPIRSTRKPRKSKRKSTSKPRKSSRKPRKSLSKSIKRKSTNTGSKKRKSTRKKLSRRRR